MIGSLMSWKESWDRGAVLSLYLVVSSPGGDYVSLFASAGFIITDWNTGGEATVREHTLWSPGGIHE